jgi:hypothetical protein
MGFHARFRRLHKADPAGVECGLLDQILAQIDAEVYGIVQGRHMGALTERERAQVESKLRNRAEMVRIRASYGSHTKQEEACQRH